jgi:hypothetical protein
MYCLHSIIKAPQTEGLSTTPEGLIASVLGAVNISFDSMM